MAAWRSDRFKASESTIRSELRRVVLRRIIESIRVAFEVALTEIGHHPLPKGFELRLRSILVTAYEWNSTIKRDAIECDLKPFVVEPGTKWNAEQMESFVLLPKKVAMPIVSTVALGLIGSVALGGRSVSHVHVKAKVLAGEWFRRTGSRPRISSFGTMVRSAHTIAPRIRRGLSESGASYPKIISTQPAPVQPMSRSGKFHSALSGPEQ